MHSANMIDTNKPEFYRELCAQLTALLAGESDPVANAANTSALIFQMIPDLNWAGFYFLQSPDELLVGPFQGKPACVRIAVGKGVCGAAVERPDQSLSRTSTTFPDISLVTRPRAQNSLCRSFATAVIFGVLDLDSPRPGQFDRDDQFGVEGLAAIYVAASSFEE